MQATTALAFLAGHSSRLRVSSNVTLVALRHPVVQAKEWGVLDWLSGGGGGADFLVGVGWLKEKFDVRRRTETPAGAARPPVVPRRCPRDALARGPLGTG